MVEQLHALQIMDHQPRVTIQPLHLAKEIGILHRFDPFLEQIDIALQLLNIFFQLLVVDPAKFFFFLLRGLHLIAKSISSLAKKQKPDA